MILDIGGSDVQSKRCLFLVLLLPCGASVVSTTSQKVYSIGLDVLWHGGMLYSDKLAWETDYT